MSNNDYEHAIVIDPAKGVITFECNATTGSMCRLVCEQDCEDVHHAECDGSTKDGGMCGAMPYLEASEAHEIYIGATDQADWQSGDIAIEWNSHFDGWHWRYPLEERREPGSVRQRAIQ